MGTGKTFIYRVGGIGSSLIVGVLLAAGFLSFMSGASASQASDIIPGTWENMGLYGGLVFDAVIDPVTNWVYLVTEGNVFRSINNGTNWEALTPGIILGATNIDISPDGALYSNLGGGLLRSIDNGENWTHLPLPEMPPGDPHVQSFALDPADAQHIVIQARNSLAPEKYVYTTWNGGQSWITATIDTYFESDIVDIAIHPNDPQLVIAANFSGNISTPSHIYRSVDGGLNFIKVLTATVGTQMAAVEINALGELFASGSYGLFRSSDGLDWEAVDSSGGNLLEFDPLDPHKIYTANCISDNDGEDWTCGYDFSDNFLAISPNDISLMFADSNTGVRRSLDGGLTWAEANNGITGVFITSLAIDPTDNQIIYVPSETGFGLTYDGGQSWSYPLPGMDFNGWAVAVDPNQDGIVYVGNHNGEFHKSTDFGQTWSITTIYPDRPTVIWELAVDPRYEKKIYAAATSLLLGDPPYYGGLYRSDDGGTTWMTTTLDGLPVNAVRACAGLTTTVVYAGVGDYGAQTIQGGVYRSEDGSTWQPAGLQEQVVNAVAIHPDDPNVVYAGVIPNRQNPGTTPPLYRSDNGGVSWTPLYPCEGCGGESLATDPNNPEVVFLSVGNGLYKSTDRGDSWQSIEWDGSGGQIQAVYAPLLAPSSVEELIAEPISNAVRLSWDNPADPDLAGVNIRVMTDTFPTAHFQGISLTMQTVAPESSDIYTHTNIMSGISYYYSVFTINADGRYSEPAWISATVPISATGSAISSGWDITQSASLPDQQRVVYAATSGGLFRIYEKSTWDVFLPIAIQR